MNAQWVRRTAVASVLLVGLVAAIISYAHIYALASRSGEGWRASLLPLSVDGMLVAASLAIVDRRRVNAPAGWVPWLGLALGIAASLAGNVAAARADLVSQIVAAWPPVALAVSIETLVVILRRSPGPLASVAEDRCVADGLHEDEETPSATDPLLDQARQVITENAGNVGRSRLAGALGVSEHRARTLLVELASSNGHGG
ncbi:DUF2637 domain-containing protein [Pseudonocardia sp. Cha107L01]|uniref:DUF2637 domain-containing protein n=1 Tax=Pseudonocardia sp. Cha107L01 TaxID=3457576 RepID=UPI00403E5219